MIVRLFLPFPFHRVAMMFVLSDPVSAATAGTTANGKERVELAGILPLLLDECKA